MAIDYSCIKISDMIKLTGGGIMENGTNINTGLLKNEVNYRLNNNMVNTNCEYKTKTIGDIIKKNSFTLFNLINVILAFLVFTTGEYKNMLFVFVIISNTIIGTIQEIRSKKIIDKLMVLNESHINILRDEKIERKSIYEIVKDDIIIISTGQQIPADAFVVDGSCETNESLLTGESQHILKNVGDTLLSGSFIVSGKVKAQVTKIGVESYVNTITSNLKYIKSTQSQIINFINKFVKFISVVILPVAILMFVKQYTIAYNYKDAIINTVAGLIGMIPEGLVLISSIVMALSVIRLYKYKALVKELYSIENLAMSDIILLDKTGTITSGNMVLENIINLNGSDNCIEDLANIINLLDDESPTTSAIKAYIKGKTSEDTTVAYNRKMPFSSDKKYSGIEYKDKTVILGAPTMVLSNDELNAVNGILEPLLDKEKRVLVLAKSSERMCGKELPLNLKAIGLLIIADEVRRGAIDTIQYFYSQDMDIKIISGDNPLSVSKIAGSVGIKNSHMYLDVSKIPDNELIESVDKYTIFGMVSPFQKLEIVKAFKRNKKYVAMIGDGVNDTLALKEANCSIAMSEGSDVAKNISDIVLLNSDFSSVPKVLDEGRRAINNIRRSSSLFTIKTIFSCILVGLFLLVDLRYPFVPIQMTLISSLAVGIPSFLLAFEADYSKIDKKFIKNVMYYSLPGGISVSLNIVLITLANTIFNLPYDIINFYYIVSTSIATFWVLILLCKPYTVYKAILSVTMMVLFVGAFVFMPEFFSIPKVGYDELMVVPVFFVSTFIFRRLVLYLINLYYNRKTFII